MSEPTIYDMHLHLDFAADPAAAAASLRDADVGAYSVTVTPDGFDAATRIAAGSEGVRVGVGLHPWWVADGRVGESEIARCCDLVRTTAFVGEIGLDFGKNCLRTASEAGVDAETARRRQVEAFTRILDAAEGFAHVFSLHLVHAEDRAFDLLEQHRVFEDSDVILHWFSGSSDQLQRAVSLGCRFSVGPRMVASKRGREYARIIPEDRLLLETDSPLSPGRPLDGATLRAELLDVVATLTEIRGTDPSAALVRNSERLLSREV